MFVKSVSLLLVLLALAYSTAPTWVDSGVSLNYSVGGGQVAFSVTGRTSSDVNINVVQQGSPHTMIENASEDSGEFWYDPSLLANAYGGKMIGVYTVTGQSSMSFAGTTWNTISLQGSVSGASTTKIFDTTTGLLLQQTISTGPSTTQTITLTQEYIPSLAPPPPAPVANNTKPSPPAQTQNTTTQPSNVSNSSTNSSSSPPIQPSQPYQPSSSQNSSQSTQSSSGQSASHKQPCCLTTMFLLLVVTSSLLKARL